MTDIDCLLIGHITADLVPDGRVLGGTPSYAARTLKQFGLRVALVTSAKHDDPLLAEITRYTDELVNIPSDVTTTYENIYEAQGRRQFVHNVAANITAQDIPDRWLNTPLVFISPMAGEVDEAVVSLFPNSHILITPQGWMRQWGADKLVHFKRWYNAQVLKIANTFVMSEEDIAAAPDVEQDYAAIAGNLVVTRGSEGGIYYENGARRTYDSVKVESKELTGAGDVFASSLLVGLHRFNDLDRAISLAAILAGYSVTRAGLESAPTPEEIDSAFKQVTT